jgi:flavin-binding protein dodecin
MAIMKTIEVMSESKKSWEDAVQNVIDEASDSVDDIKSVWVKDQTAIVKDGKLDTYRVNCKVTFRVNR